MQQGRVQLDADWNEWTDAIDRRNRVETVDTFGVFFTPGIDGVAVVSPQTPDAFLIEVSGGDIDIGQGRMYVDGLLAENFGDPDGPQTFDPLLAELRGQNPLSYTQQPFHPAPASLPTSGNHLAYLEVWQREVGHLQRPDLVEIAVGVDTTTRTQTVWQVRLLEDVNGSIDCSSPDAGLGADWADVIAPSAGRLSSRDVGVPPDLDPCELPPGGGYRGVENQLYRIEIHHGGGVGQATFKWSRDNASVAAGVVEVVSPTKLKLASLGRDAVLRFNTGDWVEITDDWRELSGKAGDPARRFGEMRKIKEVNEGSQTIGFELALPADLIPAETGDDTLEKRRLRVVRWDQKGIVRDAANNVVVNLDDTGSQGLIPVPAAGTWVALEKGVQVSFSRDPSTGDFRCNDFWNVAARTADAKAETLTEVPPQGIHRHYARLALVTFPNGETDCRIHWPPDFGGGCCTIIVEPGDDIQAAIDALGEEGGCICIKTGLHVISKPLRIENPNIVMHGESAGSVIRRENGVSMLVLDNPKGITVENVTIRVIRFENGAKPNTKDAHPDIILFSRRCTNFHLLDCVLAPQKFNFITGAWFGGLEGAVIENCDIGPVGVGVWVAEDSTGLAVLDSRLFAEYLDGVDAGSIGIWLRDAYGKSRIERNHISNFLSGVYVNRNSTDEPPYSNADGTVVIANSIERSASLGGSEKQAHLFGIEFAADRGLVRDNVLGYASAAYGGIRVCGREVLVEHNQLDCEFRPVDGSNAFPLGIQLGCPAERVRGTGESSTLHGNRLRGAQDAIIILAASGAKVTGNRVDGGKAGARYGIAAADGDKIEISDNEFLNTAFALGLLGNEDCRLEGNQARSGKMGVLAYQQANLALRGNRIGNQSSAGMLFVGLSGSTSIIGNRVEACAFDGMGRLGAPGIMVLIAGGRVHIGDCEIIDTGVSPDQSQVSQPAYGIFGLLVLECLVQGNRVTYENPALEKRSGKGEDRALWLCGYLDLEISDQLIHWGYPAQVVDNSFSGPGMTSLVEFQQLELADRIFMRFERVTFSNNHCWHWSELRDEKGGTVSLCGHRAIVMGNHVKANGILPSFNFNGMTGIYVGNDTTGPVAEFADFPTPSNSFNRQ
jgi:hypothetical protein